MGRVVVVVEEHKPLWLRNRVLAREPISGGVMGGSGTELGLINHHHLLHYNLRLHPFVLEAEALGSHNIYVYPLILTEFVVLVDEASKSACHSLVRPISRRARSRGVEILQLSNSFYGRDYCVRIIGA
ncbi:hypothetical protein CC1G_14301 [Coprinopsis cinerea okayama7|uniref:Uncharacterized protein n=1 Tax=Coprinopsis cinerea (strain Okayama-7 / 130 / ATCC MYA-4618 / FGSC 9003) TaxID=240176 RepID=D6RLS7_COPC7|nr:hypothetical protein CC1G_14301 [Coprinopsis cinerea okayama7\|eukprot:XP_002911770.1 hypothetical protein CC1G_14301 [Coprinopsis cinerea okayama7\